MNQDRLLYRPLPSFEELKSLAKNDKENFERIRQKIINSEIADSEHNKTLLERLQFRIDGVIRKNKNPVTRCQLLLTMISDQNITFLNDLDSITSYRCDIDDSKKNHLTIVK